MNIRSNAHDHGPVEGGVYKIRRAGSGREDRLRVLAVGDLDGYSTVVVEFCERSLGILPLNHWMGMFPGIELTGVDDEVPRAEFRGAGMTMLYGWVEVYVGNGRIRLDRSKDGGAPCPTTTH